MDLPSYVHQCLEGRDINSDYYHAERVTKVALEIADAYPFANRKVIKYAAMMYDIRIPSKVSIFLSRCDKLTSKEKDDVSSVIYARSIDLETKIVSDARKIDEIGAVGIIRAISQATNKKVPIHDSDVPIRDEDICTDETRASSTVVANFHEKLLHLHESLQTIEGQRIGYERTKVMQSFLKSLMLEVE